GEVIFAFFARWGGLTALAALLLILSGAIMALLYAYATLRTGNCKAAFTSCALFLPVIVVFFTLRPQLLGYIFLLFTLISLELFRQGRRRALWALPGIFLIWVNTHGTFVLGLACLGIYWLAGLKSFEWGGVEARRWTDNERRQLETVGLLSVVALLITPYGSKLAAYPVEMLLLQPVNLANIQEWQPLSFRLLLGKFLLVLLLLYFLGEVIFRFKYRLEDLALLVVAVFAACVHVRLIVFLVMVLVPHYASALRRWIPPYRLLKDHFGLNGGMMAMIAVGFVWLMPAGARLLRLTVHDYPAGAVAYLHQHPAPARMFNEYGWGGYLIWSLGPQRKVFIDGRADVYEYAGVLQDYLHMTRLAPNTLFLFRKYGIQACLVKRNAPLATMLAHLAGWKRVYEGRISALYVRRNEPPAAHERAEIRPPSVRNKSKRGAIEMFPARITPLGIGFARRFEVGCAGVSCKVRAVRDFIPNISKFNRRMKEL
ncbi:MAG TPA: hypothetical protein VKV79_01120, partial [Terriglobia bacterium]|nr:hypothetical protein [Terriglobia bacterium]